MASTRSRRNAVLREIVLQWGEPAAVATLLYLFGCDVSESYDEFLSCTVTLPGITLDVNVYARLQPAHGGDWSCTTCGLHRHTTWWAAASVAGTLVHSLAQPRCASSPADPPPPRLEELDASLAANGSAADVMGSVYTVGGVEWETTDVVNVAAGQSLLFSPSWVHRVVPAAAGATHAAVSLRVTAEADELLTELDEAVATPRGMGVSNSNYSVCFTRADLIRALMAPELRHGPRSQQLISRQRGLPIACTISPVPLAEANRVASPPFRRIDQT